MPKVDLVLQGIGLSSDQGRMGTTTVALVRGRHTILVDTSQQGRRSLLLQRLQALGVAPEDVDLIVITHTHWDHIQNLDVFPRATLLLHREELLYARAPRKGDWATASYTEAMLRTRPIEEMTVEEQALEEGVTLLFTPGHTRGSLSLLVESPEGTIGIVGDALPNARTALQGMPYFVFWDEAQARASAQKLLARCTTFYPGHDRPFHLREGQVTYLVSPPSITFKMMVEPGASDVAATLRGEPPAPLWVLRED